MHLGAAISRVFNIWDTSGVNSFRRKKRCFKVKNDELKAKGIGSQNKD
jgi:hypothetical protein